MKEQNISFIFRANTYRTKIMISTRLLSKPSLFIIFVFLQKMINIYFQFQVRILLAQRTSSAALGNISLVRMCVEVLNVFYCVENNNEIEYIVQKCLMRDTCVTFYISWSFKQGIF